MNEDIIKQKLAEHLHAQNVNQDDPGRVAESPVNQEVPEVSHNNLPLENMLLKQQTFDLLGVPQQIRQSSDAQSQIDSILRWAVSHSPSTDLTDVLKVLQEQIQVKGWQWQDDKLSRLYRYVKLNSQREALELQMGAL